MTSLKILAAAALVAISAPAFAGNDTASETTPSAVEFVAKGNSRIVIEGRNSERGPVQQAVGSKAAPSGN